MTSTVTSLGRTTKTIVATVAVAHAFWLYFDEGETHFGTFSWSGDTMIFTPNSPLTMNATFFVTVSTDARSASGYTLVAPKSWSFSIFPSGQG
jgi:hypothetical protein